MTDRLVAGTVAGLIGGIAFGAMMHALGMIGMIGELVDAEGFGAAWAVHLVIAAAIGAGYAVTFGVRDPGYGASAAYGLVYGAIWWVLGPLLLMPLFMGMGPFPPIGQDQIMSLIGHLMYGVIVGLVFVAVRERARDRVHRELQHQ